MRTSSLAGRFALDAPPLDALLLGALLLGALLLGAWGALASTVHAQVSDSGSLPVPPPPTASASAPPGYGYEPPLVLPAPPPAYAEELVVARESGVARSPVLPPPHVDPIGLRVLAETGGYFGGVFVTAALVAIVASVVDVDRDQTPLVLTMLAGYFVLMPLGTWIAGNAVEGRGQLGWTVLGNAFFSIFGAVLAYELSHAFGGTSPGAPPAASDRDLPRRAQAPGIGFTLAF